METQTVTTGLMADPGLPEKIARTIAAGLSRDLTSDAEPGTRWEVQVSQETLPLAGTGEIPLLEHAKALRNQHGWDFVVYLTDLPRSHDQQPMVCEVSADSEAALISLPALGAARLKAQTRKLLATLIRSIREGRADYPSAAAARRVLGSGAARRVPSNNENHEEDVVYIVLSGPLSRWRLLSGMVRSNRPGRLLPALSSCVAAAVATGAFGIFYASIWNMSDALHPGRLAMISAVVITALSGWLIFHNGLWGKARGTTDPWRVRLDNAATAITVGMSVAMMYAVLWVVLFTVSLAVIEADYLQSQLGHPINVLDYGHLSWLAASLGTLAGALGSNFDNDNAIREATYSRREHQRRQLADDYED